MELRQLRSFCVAARLQSISKAAEFLDIGQPTVTTHIKKLEEELGLILFDRIKRPILLTTSGESLNELAIPLIDGIDNLTANTSKLILESPVLIGATYDIIPHLLLPSVQFFNKSHPQARLNIRSGHRHEVIKMVENREVSFGIIPGREQSKGLTFKRLFKYERVLITPLGHPLLKKPVKSLADIVKYPLILLEKHSYTRITLEEEFTNQGLEFQVVMELDSMDFIKQFVSIGMGVSIGPLLAIEQKDLEKLGVIRLDNLLMEDEGGLIIRKTQSQSKHALSFMETLGLIPNEVG